MGHIAEGGRITMKTEENYSIAFAGESQANRKYTFFAEQAEKEGFAHVARLFRATAEAETIHARLHLKGKGGIGSTAENLQDANSGETYETVTMYPPMIDDAKAEGNQGAIRAFSMAKEAEAVHARLYSEALVNLGKEPADESYYLCPVCGYIHKGNAGPSELCPICKANPSVFVKY